jgi:hypothetical protein
MKPSGRESFMAKRYTPTLECLEARQALTASPSAGPAAAAPDPAQAETAPQVDWAHFLVQNVASAVATASAVSSSAQLSSSDASQSPNATPADNGPAASPGSAAGSSSPQATAPSREDSGNSSGPNRSDKTLTANEGGLSKDTPLAHGKFPRKADESADRPHAEFPSQGPTRQEARHPSDAGAPPEPTGLQGGDPPKGIGGSERAPPDWTKLLTRVRSTVNPRDQFSSGPADGLTDATASLTGVLTDRLHAAPLKEGSPSESGDGSVPGALAGGLGHFLDPKALEVLLANLWAAPVRGAVPVSVGQRPDSPPSGAPEQETGVTPLVLGAVLLPKGQPLDPVERGYQYLCQYARQSIYAAERRVGPLRDHDDIVQQVCVEWLEQAGPPAEALPRLLEQAPAEMQLLRAVVTRVIARAVYQQKKQYVVLDANDWPARGNAAERDWAEFKADCEQGVGNLSRREWQVLDLRRQGKTFQEIGAELRLPRQRVWEVYRAVEARLREIYGKKDG